MIFIFNLIGIATAISIDPIIIQIPNDIDWPYHAIGQDRIPFYSSFEDINDGSNEPLNRKHSSDFIREIDDSLEIPVLRGGPKKRLENVKNSKKSPKPGKKKLYSEVDFNISYKKRSRKRPRNYKKYKSICGPKRVYYDNGDYVEKECPYAREELESEREWWEDMERYEPPRDSSYEGCVDASGERYDCRQTHDSRPPKKPPSYDNELPSDINSHKRPPKPQQSYNNEPSTDIHDQKMPPKPQQSYDYEPPTGSHKRPPKPQQSYDKEPPIDKHNHKRPPRPQQSYDYESPTEKHNHKRPPRPQQSYDNEPPTDIYNHKKPPKPKENYDNKPHSDIHSHIIKPPTQVEENYNTHYNPTTQHYSTSRYTHKRPEGSDGNNNYPFAHNSIIAKPPGNQHQHPGNKPHVNQYNPEQEKHLGPHDPRHKPPSNHPNSGQKPPIIHFVTDKDEPSGGYTTKSYNQQKSTTNIALITKKPTSKHISTQVSTTVFTEKTKQKISPIISTTKKPTYKTTLKPITTQKSTQKTTSKPVTTKKTTLKTTTKPHTTKKPTPKTTIKPKTTKRPTQKTTLKPRTTKKLKPRTTRRPTTKRTRRPPTTKRPRRKKKKKRRRKKKRRYKKRKYKKRRNRKRRYRSRYRSSRWGCGVCDYKLTDVEHQKLPIDFHYETRRSKCKCKPLRLNNHYMIV